MNVRLKKIENKLGFCSAYSFYQENTKGRSSDFGDCVFNRFADPAFRKYVLGGNEKSNGRYKDKGAEKCLSRAFAPISGQGAFVIGHITAYADNDKAYDPQKNYFSS